MSYLIDTQYGNGTGTSWTISHCQKCGSSNRSPNRTHPEKSTCAKCPQPWPFFNNFKSAWDYYTALGKVDPNPRHNYPNHLTGHHPSVIIADDPQAEAPSQPKPPIDWFAINKEFSQ